jgi:hypothetical protein
VCTARTAVTWLVGLIRANLLLCAALAAGAALRVLALVAYPGVIWFYGDSYVYLATALRPRPDLTKTVGYSFFLRALEPLHSFTLVAAVRHMLGLATGVLVYVLLRRARLPEWGATLAALPVLLDAYVIQLEHLLMSDILSSFAECAKIDPPAPERVLCLSTQVRDRPPPGQTS